MPPVVREPLAQLLVQVEAELIERDEAIRRPRSTQRPLIDAASRLAHGLERCPRVRAGQKPREEIAAAFWIKEVRLPPAETTRLRATFASPGNRELQR